MFMLMRFVILPQRIQRVSCCGNQNPYDVPRLRHRARWKRGTAGNFWAVAGRWPEGSWKSPGGGWKNPATCGKEAAQLNPEKSG